jgi:hypothetical protein
MIGHGEVQLQMTYIKSCSHEVAIQAQIRGNMPIPSDGTTFSHHIKEDDNNAHAHFYIIFNNQFFIRPGYANYHNLITWKVITVIPLFGY